ncbi:MAG: DUF2849 domain-containing protein [Sulfitobacter sp.]|nr:DUF2849 domain-containing protein [Sulfitobacter sp.]
MPKPFTPKIVTANALLEGDVIYQTLTGWSRRIEEAEVLTDEAHADLRLIEASAQTREVIGAYLAEVELDGSRPRPAHFREAFRARGPSNYAHGKQQSKTQPRT